MTENKRFKNVEENLEWGTVQYFTYYDEKINDEELEKLVNHLLNQNDELNDENKQLAKEKERYKRLSEIRREEINNRILTIKEFIENCSDNKVKKILKDLFYSEVNEYDLSSENRKLLHENEQLKEEIETLHEQLAHDIGDLND